MRAKGTSSTRERRGKQHATPSFELWAADVISKIVELLNLREWRVEVKFGVEDEESGCVAVTHANPRYLTAYIEFTPHAAHLWEEQDLVILHEAVVHEVVHVLLAPLQGHAEKSASPQTKEHLTDILEQTTQRITRVILAFLPHDYFA